MFRASDIFGRRAGTNVPKGVVKVPASGQKRAVESEGPTGPSSRTWDPATGKFVQEELPAEVQEMMGIQRKKVKAESAEPQDHGRAWTPAAKTGLLGPKSVGMGSQAAGATSDPLLTKVDVRMPSIEYKGFQKVDLNDRYYERPSAIVHKRLTYWTEDGSFFIYWQGEGFDRWAITDGPSYRAVRAGQLPGWAYKSDHRHLCTANGWREAWEGTWSEPDLEIIFRSASHHQPVWDDPVAQKSITTVEFFGFTMKELNGRYHLRSGENIQGHPSYWDVSGVYFIYWQQSMRRWAICDLKCLEAVKSGQCPGWAYRDDAGYFANACGWKETRASQWVDANIQTSVISTCTKGLKVEFSGFNKEELNTQYLEAADEEVQGRATFWDATHTYFVYWQSSMKRWAICDSVSLSSAKSGLSPGWAYRTDSQHFAKSSGWLEAWGREWRSATVSCTVLEGVVKDDSALIKAEPGSNSTAGSGTLLSVDQYKKLVTKVYEEKNPAKLADLSKIFMKYQGREHELFAQVCEKYQADAEALAAGLPAVTSSAASEKAGEGAEQDEFVHLENAPVPELSAREYAILIQSAYERYNPAKLADLARLLAKWRHREKDLYLQVCDKYGAHPAKFHAQCVRDENQPRPEEPAEELGMAAAVS